ncbi:MAG: metallophosphoesterase [Bacteriovoracaceae bacterium]|jgi:UDP-2,3-diacylglucosamine pyrophosphatase LpxH|nr:metallophosphoesterase [Bacteriovoracaceae bacterium]
MRFLRKSIKKDKTVIVISDLHLGAGYSYEGKRNVLEDFHADEELVSFLKYYSSGDYQNQNVELIINGDFLDLLAIPFVPYFDDEYWSEDAAICKLKIILDAHKEVMLALNNFVKSKFKTITYIIGNHDGEMVFKSLQQIFIKCFDEELRQKIDIKANIDLYRPIDGVYIEHGHNYEVAHAFDQNDSIVTASNDKKYFVPSWGAYYVTHIINRYKQERHHVNAVRPIRKFLIHGLIFDTLFILRFMIANAYYFVMVRLLLFKKTNASFRQMWDYSKKDLALFQDYEALTRNFFTKHEDAKVLVVGHTHEPIYREFLDGTSFINTGTWTQMISLDLDASHSYQKFTYAIIEKQGEQVEAALNVWAPKSDLPYFEF